MYVSQIATIQGYIDDRVRTLIYKTIITENGKSVISCQQYFYEPYNHKGVVEQISKGDFVDIKI